MKAEIERQMGGVAIFMQGAAGDQSANKKPDADYVQFGNALAAEAVKLASGLPPQEVSHPSLQVEEERFVFKSRVDLANPLVRGAYQKAFFPELIPNFINEHA